MSGAATAEAIETYYEQLRDHAQQCRECLGDLTLAVVSLRVCGEIRFEPLSTCELGGLLLAEVSELLQHAESRPNG